MQYTCYQKKIVLKGRKRGVYLVTAEVMAQARELIQSIQTGVCFLFLMHTSAALSINENADLTVREDMNNILHDLVPDSSNYRHNYEGEDDMPAHALSTLTGCSLTIPISGGTLALGTWQGIYLLEYRHFGGDREIVVTVQGVAAK